MKNLPFVIWMLGFPLTITIDKFVCEYLIKKTYSDSSEAIALIIFLIIWIVVGKLLYEK